MTLKCAVLLLGLFMAQCAAADESEAPVHASFNLTAPTEFRGIWERPAAPFVNPIETRNWVSVRIQAIDANTGTVHGKLDFYVRSVCYDLVDEPFTGTFDGHVLKVSVEYTLCPLMKPLLLQLWKEDDGFHARANWWPIVIKEVIAPKVE